MSYVQSILQLLFITFNILHVSQTFYLNSRYPQTPPQATWGGNTANNVRLPSVACPSIFSYEYAPDRGWYGFLKIPKLGDQTVFNVEINMTVNRLEFSSGAIHLELLSNDEEIKTARDIRLILSLPYQDVLPKMTQIKLNSRIICVDNPEPVLPGQAKTNMWTRLAVNTQYGKGAYNLQLQNFPSIFTPPAVFPIITNDFSIFDPITIHDVLPIPHTTIDLPQRTGGGGFLSDLGRQMSEMFNIRLNGAVAGGYSANFGDFYSQGEGQLRGGLSGNPDAGFDGEVVGEGVNMDGYGDHGYVRAATGGISGSLTGKGLNLTGGLKRASAPWKLE